MTVWIAMCSMQKDKRKRNCFSNLLLILAVLMIWQLCASAGFWSSYILPSPGKVAGSFLVMIKSGELFADILISGKRVIMGVASAVAVTILMEVLGYFSQIMRQLILKIVRFMQNVPPLSLIPMLILWFGIGERTKVIFITLGCFAPIFINFDKGIKGCEQNLLEVGQCYRFTKQEMLTKILLPSAEYDILTGLRVGFSYAWKSVVGAEMIAATSGLGYMIRDAQFMARTDKILVGIITIGAIGFAVDCLLTRLVDARRYPGGEADG